MSLTLIDGDVVRLGSRVQVRDAEGEDEFEVVAPEEADAMAARVSADSPVGRAILGHRAGDHVLFRAPGGVQGVTVLAIR